VCILGVGRCVNMSRLLRDREDEEMDNVVQLRHPTRRKRGCCNKWRTPTMLPLHSMRRDLSILITELLGTDFTYKLKCDSKISPRVFWHFSPNGWEFLVQILRGYYTFQAKLDYTTHLSPTMTVMPKCDHPACGRLMNILSIWCELGGRA